MQLIEAPYWLFLINIMRDKTNSVNTMNQRYFFRVLYFILTCCTLQSCCIEDYEDPFFDKKVKIITVCASEKASVLRCSVIESGYFALMKKYHEKSLKEATPEFSTCFNLKNFSGCLSLIKRELMEEINGRISFRFEESKLEHNTSTSSTHSFLGGRLINIIASISISDLDVTGPRWFEDATSFRNRLERSLLNNLNDQL